MSLYKGEKLFYIEKKWEMETHISIDKLYHIYKTKEIEVIALNNFSLKIKKGEFLVIMGPSGSGKTTLIKILAGLMPPSLGSVYIKMKNEKINDITQYSDNELILYRLMNVGYIQQHFNLFTNLTAFENVVLPELIKIEENKESLTPEKEKMLENKVEEIMKYVNIYERRHHKPNQMSGGEQQRVAIASALIKDPEIIIADEPTGELDSENSVKIFSLLKQIAHEKGKTVIAVSHNNLIKNFCDRVINIIDGHILDDNSLKNETE